MQGSLLFVQFILAVATVAALMAIARAADQGSPKPPNSQPQVVKIEVLPGFPPFDNIDDPHPPEQGSFEVNGVVEGDRPLGNSTSAVELPYIDVN